MTEELIYQCAAGDHMLDVTLDDHFGYFTVWSNYHLPWYKRVWKAFSRKTTVSVVLSPDDMMSLSSRLNIVWVGQ